MELKEKVLEGLGYCLSNVDDACPDCPYLEKGTFCIRYLLDDARTIILEKGE